MKTPPVTTAVRIALATLVIASATLSHAQTAPPTPAAQAPAPPVTVVLKRNSLTLTEGRKTATVKADRITHEKGKRKSDSSGPKPGDGFQLGEPGSLATGNTRFHETTKEDKADRYRLRGDYHIVTPDGWEWTGHDAELIVTDITPSRGRKQNLVVVNAIGPMHQRRPVIAPDGTKTFLEHDITDKPVAPGAFAGISFYIDSPTYIINELGKEEIRYSN